MKRKIAAAAIAILASCLFASGCLNGKTGVTDGFVPMPYLRFDPVLTLEIVNKYGTSDETELCNVVFSKDADMSTPFKRLRLERTCRLEFSEFKAGEKFYIGAFIDLDRDMAPTYGTEPIGGAYAAEYDPAGACLIEILAGRTSEAAVKILRPIAGRKPENDYFGTGPVPLFSWNPMGGIDRFEMTVYDKISAAPEWRALICGNSISYGENSGNSVTAMIKPEYLEADRRHYWTMKGYGCDGHVWAYGREMSLLP